MSSVCQVIQISDEGIHHRNDVLARLVRVAKSQHVAKFMQKYLMDILNPGSEVLPA